MKPIIVRGAGDVATGTIHRLSNAGYPVIALEVPKPSAIRWQVAFSSAVYDGSSTVEGMTALLAHSFREAAELACQGTPAILVDPERECLKDYRDMYGCRPWFLVDGILAKKNLGTTRDMADTVVALGPGFCAGEDVDYVIETMRGHNLARIFSEGTALPNTGIPGMIMGHGADRVMHAPAEGISVSRHRIGDYVEAGEILAMIRNGEEETPLTASITGLLRGLIPDGYPVTKGLKVADIDPRRDQLKNCFTISDKARAVGGSVLELAVRAQRGLLTTKG